VGALAVVAVVVMFGRPTVRWVGRLGESPAEAKVRQYKEARHELADPKTATREQSSVEAELTAHEKDLLEAGYWEPADSREASAKVIRRDTRREPGQEDFGERNSDGSNQRMTIRERRQQLRRSERTNQTESSRAH